ncbi:hypothetical protein C0J52_09361 [Blattella germanica]|nr:hypothetical protein C0J52_09361 [Blattella germanica]
MSSEVTPSWLDNNFLQTALGEDVAKFEAKSLGDSKDFFTSTLYRAVVELKSGKKEYLIIKKLNTNEGDGLSVSDSSMFDREMHMYGIVMPKLAALLEKAFPGMEPIAPKHFYSSSGVIVLEDLSVSGFKMLDRIEGLNLQQTMEVMKMLGRFHGASVILYEEDPDCFNPYLKSLFTERPIRELQKKYYINWPGFGERYSKKLREMAVHMQEMNRNASRRQESRFNVLTHDDVWVCNLMFREPHGEYHKSLHETLVALGYKKELPTLEDVLEEYKKSSSYGFVVSVVYLPANYATADIDIPMFDPDAPPVGREIYEGSKYRMVMQELFRDFEKLGAFSVD